MMTFKSKYKVGQRVWVMSYNKPYETEINSVIVTCNYDDASRAGYEYILKAINKDPIHETKLFPSKKKLMDSL